MSWTVAQLAKDCGGEVGGDGTQSVTSVSTDTRTLEAGALFVALRGENFDAHDYLDQAIARGARAVLIERDCGALEVPSILVGDAVEALGELARAHRARFDLPVVGITGSNGKTTTKEICAGILEQAGLRVRRTRGNLNNHIGLPLTVLGLDEHDQALVVEMGMNHAGEIAKLSRIASPSVGAITNIAPAHLGPLGSIEAIARAKGELYAGTQPDGTVVVNLDDAHCVEQARRFAGRQLGFGRCAEAGVRGTPEPATDGHAVFELETGYGRTRVRLGAPGLHLIEDALCATAAALASGLCGDAPLDAIRAGLEGFKGMPGRLAIRSAPGSLTVIDDSYNSNPHSVRVALETLVEMRGDGRCMALLGDMLELGPDETEIHAEVGRLAAELAVDVLIAVGPLSRNTARAARAAGLAQVDDVEDAPAAAKRARELAKPGDTLLVKGSRGMAMERAVSALVEAP